VRARDFIKLRLDRHTLVSPLCTLHYLTFPSLDLLNACRPSRLQQKYCILRPVHLTITSAVSIDIPQSHSTIQRFQTLADHFNQSRPETNATTHACRGAIVDVSCTSTIGQSRVSNRTRRSFYPIKSAIVTYEKALWFLEKESTHGYEETRSVSVKSERSPPEILAGILYLRYPRVSLLTV
jgi:hypothetical protein